jgi:hypothetical protein
MQTQLPGMTLRGQLLAKIRNHYWHLRALRPGQLSRRRWLYRQIEKCKDLLLLDGVDAEWLRLFCRQYASMNRAAGDRFRAYDEKISTDLQKYPSS